MQLSELDQVNTETFHLVSVHGCSFPENHIHICYVYMEIGWNL